MASEWQLFLSSLPLEILLFVTAFIAATLIPTGSEVLLVASVLATPDPMRWVALTFVASLGNTLRAMTSWLIGRYIPQKEFSARGLAWIDRYGLPVLLLFWLPVVGDVLPIIAGWRRLDWRWSFLFIAIGKTARFVVVVVLALTAKGML